MNLSTRRLAARAGRAALLVAGFALLTALLTWPIATRAATAGPTNTGDGQLSIWNVCWVARGVVQDPRHLYDANIFAPHAGTLAYSEANLVAGLLAVPAWWATGNPYLAYNSAILLAFLLGALAMFALARRLTGSTPASVVAAIAFAFAPVTIVRLAHVQLLMTAGLPLTLLALHRFVDRPSGGRAAALSNALVLAALGSGYFGIFAGLAVACGFAYYGVTRRLWGNPRYVAAAAGVVLLAGLLILPFFLPYLQLERGGTAFRSIEESRRYSADWRSYLTSTAHLQQWLLGWVLPFDRTAFPERVLFPGFVTIGLACVALSRVAGLRGDGTGLKRWPASIPSAAESIGFYALLAVVAAWLSFGPAAGLYWLAYRFVPGFTLTRAPARFGVLVALALAVLAAHGCALLLRGRRRPAVAGALLAALVAGELAAVPLDVRPALPEPAPYRVLAQMPRGTVAEFPFFYLDHDLYRSCLYMLYSTRHWQPLANGYSDYIPEDYRQTVLAISTFPSREAFRLLRPRGVRYAVFHLELYDRRSRVKLRDAIGRYHDYLRPLAQTEDTLLYEVVAWPQ